MLKPKSEETLCAQFAHVQQCCREVLQRLRRVFPEERPGCNRNKGTGASCKAACPQNLTLHAQCFIDMGSCSYCCVLMLYSCTC